MTALDFTLTPAERFGTLVVFLDEDFNGLAQLIFGFETRSAECLALQQTENDLHLVQPTRGSRREVKMDATFEFCQPVIVLFMCAIVVEDDVDLFILRLIGQHIVEETAEILPLLVLGELRVNLAGADFQSRE